MYLTFEQMKHRVEELEYFPAWRLSVYDGAFEGYKLLIEADVDDYTGKAEKIHLHVVRPIDGVFKDIETFDVWLVKTLNRLAIHESMEALRVRKTRKALIDPHRDGSDRDLIYT